jgi:hypothetical protein
LASRKLKKLVIGKETQCQQTVGSRTAWKQPWSKQEPSDSFMLLPTISSTGTTNWYRSIYTTAAVHPTVRSIGFSNKWLERHRPTHCVHLLSKRECEVGGGFAGLPFWGFHGRSVASNSLGDYQVQNYQRDVLLLLGAMVECIKSTPKAAGNRVTRNL